MMMSTTSATNKLVLASIGTCLIVVCLAAIAAQAQYNAYDSDSNSDSDRSPILTNSELGKLVRNSAKAQANQNYHRHNQQQLAATRNLYNRQQPLQYAPTHNTRSQYGSADGLNGFGPMMGASSGRGSNANNDDDEDGGNFGPNFGANFDGGNDGDGESNADGQPMNLNQAASGYPSRDYNDNAGIGFGFGGSSGYGPSSGDGSEFGPSDGFGGEGRRAKSASSLMGSRNYGSDDDAGAPQFGPNSAVNSGERDVDDDGRSGYAPEGQNDNDGDDE